MVRRFNDGDLVLAKVAGSPPWPAVVRPCNVTDDDESFKFNGEYYRRPDWYVFRTFLYALVLKLTFIWFKVLGSVL